MPCATEPGAAYFDHNYGVCALMPCACLVRREWHGELCQHWQPLRVRSWAELRDRIIAETYPQPTRAHSSPTDQ